MTGLKRGAGQDLGHNFRIADILELSDKQPGAVEQPDDLSSGANSLSSLCG
jgi:hypothetical protein